MLVSILFHLGEQSDARRLKVVEILGLVEFDDGVEACFHAGDFR
jgi:hypothetical protein